MGEVKGDATHIQFAQSALALRHASMLHTAITKNALAGCHACRKWGMCASAASSRRPASAPTNAAAPCSWRASRPQSRSTPSTGGQATTARLAGAQLLCHPVMHAATLSDCAANHLGAACRWPPHRRQAQRPCTAHLQERPCPKWPPYARSRPVPQRTSHDA